MSEPKSVTVTIYGQDYTLRGDADTAYVERVAALVDQKMREISQRSDLASTSKVAILAAVNLADDLLREQQKHQEALHLLEERTNQISAFLEREMDKL
ncbi:cell division protein ZapA [bacterium]|nr:cell division protein ZapA [bacterium]HPF34990.1 cell division protein ZapA [Candidatus Krumholzibacteria bacterium]HRX50725.1 cell division protein ZapA [Candidatus Krumholzibacteria bacterium]